MKRVLSVMLVLLMAFLSSMPNITVSAAETATTMRLVSTEGTVSVTNKSGRVIKISNNMKLYNAYYVTTSAKSYAYVSLDDDKAIKMDAGTQIEIRKSGKKLEIHLLAGKIFCNVKAPLKSGESLNITTSTTITGIRGTSLSVSTSEGNTDVQVYSGLVNTLIRDLGESVDIAAGQKLTEYTGNTKLQQLDIEDISGFIAVLLLDTPEFEEILQKIDIDTEKLKQDAKDILKSDEEKWGNQDVYQQQTPVATEPESVQVPNFPSNTQPTTEPTTYPITEPTTEPTTESTTETTTEETTESTTKALDQPTNVVFDKNGKITFTMGENNSAAGSTYSYTLYKNNVAVYQYIDDSVYSGETIVGLADKMLEAAGAYTVKVIAKSENEEYSAKSNKSVSNTINVYSVTVNIENVNGTDKVEGYSEDYTKYLFAGEDITLTATPDTDRKVIWSGSIGSSSNNIYTITNINTNVTVTATFTKKVTQTISKSTYSTNTPLIGEEIITTDGTYIANDGGNEGIHHTYQWKRSDNVDRTGNIIDLATTKDYTPVSGDFGKYIWLETTPVGDGSVTGTMVKGDVLRVGVKLIATVTDVNDKNSSATVEGDSSKIIYSIEEAVNINVDNMEDTEFVGWNASPDVGSFGKVDDKKTTYILTNIPNIGTITLTAVLEAKPGSKDNPFLVESKEQLSAIGSGVNGWNLDSHYKQTEIIDATNLEGFSPIGSIDNPFVGTYDGNEKTISNIPITTYPGEDKIYVGLFGYVGTNGMVKNVNIIDPDYENNQITNVGDKTVYTGGIVAYNEGSIINCNVTGGIYVSSGNDAYVGSLVGYNTGNITNSYSNRKISVIAGKNSYVGGVAGYNKGSVDSCYANGKIEVSSTLYSYTGGMTGYNNNSITNCYTTGEIFANSGNGQERYVGGVVGYNNENSVISNCYTISSLEIGNDPGINKIGSIAGYNKNSASITNCVALSVHLKINGFGDNYMGRIIGDSSTGSTVSNNYWRNDMIAQGEDFDMPETEGTEISETNWNNPNWWIINANFSSDDWMFTENKLPILKTIPVEPFTVPVEQVAN